MNTAIRALAALAISALMTGASVAAQGRGRGHTPHAAPPVHAGNGAGKVRVQGPPSAKPGKPVKPVKVAKAAPALKAVPKAKVARPAASPSIVFTTRDRSIVTDYFSINRASLPPGLAKRDRLPPGLERQLITRGTLPPGLQRYSAPLPLEINRRLTPLPSGYRRLVVGDDIVVVQTKSGVIYDVIRNAVRR
jgi:hypothetical protein